jgi:RNA polymerase sigma-54 factor
MQRQTTNQIQQHTVLPQQIQLLKLFHLTTIELEQRIKEEIDENPLLSEEESQDSIDTVNDVPDFKDEEEYKYDDISDYPFEYSNYKSFTNGQRQYKEPIDFRRSLKDQIGIHLLSEKENAIADFLIDSVNHGLLDHDISTLVDDVSLQLDLVVEQTEVETILARLLRIEPCGIGCRSIREFLLFQLRNMEPNENVKNGILVLVDCFEELSQRRLKMIAQRINISEQELMSVIDMIGKLKRKPVIEMNESPANKITYDFIVRQTHNGVSVSLVNQHSPFLFVDRTFTTLLEKPTKTWPESSSYWKSKLSSAIWFVSAVQQWEDTMLAIMKEIIAYQQAYFKEGDITLLRPMVLKTIADKLEMDISTVSRITCNKYADTHFGTIALKRLFTTGIANEKGETTSSKVIQNVIKGVVDTENKLTPYTDHQLATLLTGKGYPIARRTVSKYRVSMQIPIAQQRLAWS